MDITILFDRTESCALPTNTDDLAAGVAQNTALFKGSSPFPTLDEAAGDEDVFLEAVYTWVEDNKIIISVVGGAEIEDEELTITEIELS